MAHLGAGHKEREPQTDPRRLGHSPLGLSTGGQPVTLGRNPMTVRLHPHEADLLANLPEGDLIDLAVELDISVPASIERDALLHEAIERIAQLARREGLPFSEYDRMDLDDLPGEHMQALAELVGAQASVDGLLRSGRKVYKQYRKVRPNSQVALLLPMLLGPLARYASETR